MTAAPAQLGADRHGVPPEGRHSTAGSVTSLLSGELLAALVLAAGFVARLLPAGRYFLNPDEALHYALADQSSLRLAWGAALTNAHPPLLIVVLYYVRLLGHSELLLRMPSVLAGTACCWIFYQWLKLVTDRTTALIGLLLSSFAPALIALSSEVRQYALLLFFMVSCLSLSERALRKNSPLGMMLFSLSLYGALLSHYSSLIFAFTMGVYMLVRLYPFKKWMRLFAIWAAGQAGALALVSYFLITHVARLKKSGMAQEIADTWLRKSIFHPGTSSVAAFVPRQTIRVFTYLFSHGLVGTLVLLAFLAGMALLLWRKAGPWNGIGPSQRQLALLLGLPFVVNCLAAIAGQYPYGGTRHNAVLGLFAISGASIALAAWRPAISWIKFLVIAGALAVCNFFPSPHPAIREKDQSRDLMEQAADYMHSLPAGSVILSDYQSALLLGYYVCGHEVVQILELSWKTDCGPYAVVTTHPDEWEFHASDLADQLSRVAAIYNLAPASKVWLFDAGWIGASAPGLYVGLRSLGCSAPRNFGNNIFVCELTVPERAAARGMTK